MKAIRVTASIPSMRYQLFINAALAAAENIVPE
jgi:predicted DNA binding CopG/RHH family protein